MCTRRVVLLFARLYSTAGLDCCLAVMRYGKYRQSGQRPSGSLLVAGRIQCDFHRRLHHLTDDIEFNNTASVYQIVGHEDDVMSLPAQPSVCFYIAQMYFLWVELFSEMT